MAAVDEPSDDDIFEELWRRFTLNGIKEPLFKDGPDFPSRLQQLIADESGRELALAMLDFPDPHVLPQASTPDDHAKAFLAESDVFDALRAMGPSPVTPPSRQAIQARLMGYRTRIFRRK